MWLVSALHRERFPCSAGLAEARGDIRNDENKDKQHQMIRAVDIFGALLCSPTDDSHYEVFFISIYVFLSLRVGEK